MNAHERLGLMDVLGICDPLELLDRDDLVTLSTALSLWRAGPTPIADRAHADRLQDRLRQELLRRIRQEAEGNGGSDKG